MKSGKPVLLSTAYMPPVHYFGLMVSAPEVFIEQHETYQKQTYRNRCEICTANGKLALTIPVIKTNGNHTKINDIIISEQSNWQVLHWRAIRSAYANAPFFLFYQEEISLFYQTKFENLVDFNHRLMIELMSLAGIEKKISFTDRFEKHPRNLEDYRFSITPKVLPVLFQFRPYYQTFGEKHGFIPGLSLLDLLFNMGPETLKIIS
jgi:hypothetical protein